MGLKCERSGKIMHLSENMALTALLEVHTKRIFQSGKQPVNFYKCAFCGAWHLTAADNMHPELAKLLKRLR